jgi:nucleoside-diphosphate-sugar epimerase
VDRRTNATEPRDESGRIVREAETLLTTDAVVLRFAGIYGPGRLIGAVGLRAGKPIAGDPNGWLNLIHVADGANAVVAAIDRGQGVYNVADGSPVLRCDFYSYLAELIGAGFPTFSPIGDAPNRRINARRMRRSRYNPVFRGLPAGLLAAYHEEYERS